LHGAMLGLLIHAPRRLTMTNHAMLAALAAAAFLGGASTSAQAAECHDERCFCEGIADCNALFESDQCKPGTFHAESVTLCIGAPPPQGWCEPSETAVLTKPSDTKQAAPKTQQQTGSCGG
jgi:hypothetical protein